MNHQGQCWNVHYVANVGLRKRLNLCKRGFKIYDLLVIHWLIISLFLFSALIHCGMLAAETVKDQFCDIK